MSLVAQSFYQQEPKVPTLAPAERQDLLAQILRDAAVLRQQQEQADRVLIRNFEIGARYNQLRDHDLHVDLDRPDPETAWQDVVWKRTFSRTHLYQCGLLARYVPRDWVVAAGEKGKMGVALALIQGPKVLSHELLQVLWDRSLLEGWSARKAGAAHDAVHLHLARGEEPTERDLHAWIEEGLAGLLVLTPEQALAQADRNIKSLLKLLFRLPVAEREAVVATLAAGDEAQAVVQLLSQGERRRTERSGPEQNAENNRPGADTPARSGPEHDEGRQQAEENSRPGAEPVARSGPEHREDERAGADTARSGPEQTGTGPTPTAAPPFKLVPRPHQWAPEQVDLAVPYMPGLGELTTAEIQAGRVIVTYTYLVTLLDSALEFQERRYNPGPPEMCHMLLDTRQRMDYLAAAIKEALTPPPKDGDYQRPVRFNIDEDFSDQAVSWVSFEPYDYRSLETVSEGNPLTPHVTYLLGCAQTLLDEMFRLRDQLNARVPMALPVQHQLYEIFDRYNTYNYFQFGHFKMAANYFDKYLEEHAEERALREAERQLRASQTIHLGDTVAPPQYTLIGTDNYERPVSISQYTPQLVLAIGRQGVGKSHLAGLIMEGSIYPVEGLGQMKQKSRVIRLGSDWHQGSGGDFVRCGFYANQDPEQWTELRQRFGVRRQGAGSYGGTLFCLPESVETFKQRYADLMERGLRIRSLSMHPSEWAQFGYSAFLLGGGEGEAGRPAYKALIDSIIAHHGADAAPEVVRRELGKARLDHRVEAAIQMQLRQLEKLVDPAAYLIDALEDPHPVLIYLESRYLGKDQILPLQVAAMNALTRPLRNGEDPHRWIIQDELTQHLLGKLSGMYYVEGGALLRHRPVSYYLAGQRVLDIPRGLTALPTVVVIFHMTSYADFKAAQEQIGLLHGVTYKQVAALKEGQALIGGVSRSDGGQGMFVVNLRPSVWWVGGETKAAM